MHIFFVVICLLFASANAQTVAPTPTPSTISTPVPTSPAPAVTDSLAQKRFEKLTGLLRDAQPGTPGGAPVARPARVPQADMPDLGGLALRMTLGLLVVLVLLYALWRLARRLRGMDGPVDALGTRNLQILETSYLSPAQKLILVRIGDDRVVLIGATASQITTLSELVGAEAKAALERKGIQPIAPAQFNATVNQLLARFKKGDPP